MATVIDPRQIEEDDDLCDKPSNMFVNHSLVHPIPTVFHLLGIDGDRYLQRKYFSQVALMFQGSVFMTLGVTLSIFLSAGADGGSKAILSALGYITGMLMVVFSQSSLFTQVDIMLPAPSKVVSLRDRCSNCLGFWWFGLIINFLSACLVAAAIRGSRLLDPAHQDRAWEWMAYKLRDKDEGSEGWWRTVLSGTLGNWLAGLALMLSRGALGSVDKLFALALPLLVLGALDLAFAPADIGLMCVGLMNTYSVQGELRAAHTDAIGWDAAVWHVMLPAALGNVIGVVLYTFALGTIHWYVGEGKHWGKWEPASLPPPSTPTPAASAPPLPPPDAKDGWGRRALSSSSNSSSTSRGGVEFVHVNPVMKGYGVLGVKRYPGSGVDDTAAAAAFSYDDGGDTVEDTEMGMGGGGGGVGTPVKSGGWE